VAAALYAILALFAFWHGYVHAMGLYRARLQGRLVGLSLIMSLPVVFVTFLLDVLLQFTVVALIFWEWPTEPGFTTRQAVKFGRTWTIPWPRGDWFVTDRLRRYIAAGPELGWRYKLAWATCYYLADPFDPTGAHCDSETPTLKA
jgi:hypothetical protein